jgi:hypothetical protein
MILHQDGRIFFRNGLAYRQEGCSSPERAVLHQNGPFHRQTGQLSNRLSRSPPKWAISNQNGRFAARAGGFATRPADFSSEPADFRLHQDISRQNGAVLAETGDSPPKWAESAFGWKISHQNGTPGRKVCGGRVERSANALFPPLRDGGE